VPRFVYILPVKNDINYLTYPSSGARLHKCYQKKSQKYVAPLHRALPCFSSTSMT
jgi:hypothetical protein